MINHQVEDKDETVTAMLILVVISLLFQVYMLREAIIRKHKDFLWQIYNSNDNSRLFRDKMEPRDSF